MGGRQHPMRAASRNAAERVCCCLCLSPWCINASRYYRAGTYTRLRCKVLPVSRIEGIGIKRALLIISRGNGGSWGEYEGECTLYGRIFLGCNLDVAMQHTVMRKLAAPRRCDLATRLQYPVCWCAGRLLASPGLGGSLR
eukprot:jgi/Mesvir1/16144/Mv26469-RA.1